MRISVRGNALSSNVRVCSSHLGLCKGNEKWTRVVGLRSSETHRLMRFDRNASTLASQLLCWCRIVFCRGYVTKSMLNYAIIVTVLSVSRETPPRVSSAL